MLSPCMASGTDLTGGFERKKKKDRQTDAHRSAGLGGLGLSDRETAAAEAPGKLSVLII